MIISAVLDEMERANTVHTHMSMISNDRRLRVLVEEVGEVAKALHLTPGRHDNNLQEELVQVAATAVNWLYQIWREEEQR